MSPDQVSTPTPAELAAARVAQMQLRDWVDAYGVTLETNIAAACDPVMRQTVADAEHHIELDLEQATSEAEREQLRAALANQKQVKRVMEAFNVDAFRATLDIWRRVRADLLNVSWDLSRDVEFLGRPNGDLWARQGAGAFMKWQPLEGQAVVTFMRWVHTHQNEVRDPVAYTKAMLQRQGITAENFHEHADRLAIRNPWQPDLIIKPG